MEFDFFSLSESEMLMAACELADVNVFNWYNLIFGNELC